MVSVSVLARPKGEPLFSNTELSLHLDKLGYPPKAIHRFLYCGEINKSAYSSAFCECGVQDVDLTFRCNLRLCPSCSGRNKRKFRKKYYHFLNRFSSNRKDFRYFLTISPKNYDDLDFGIRDIRKSFQRFIRLKYVKERIKFGLYVIEVKKSRGSWNIHIHAIIYGQELDNKMRGYCRDCHQNLLKKDYQDMRFFCKSCNSKNVIPNDDSKIVTLWKKTAKRDVNIHITTKWVDKRTGKVIYLKHNTSACLNYMLKYVSSSKEDFETVEDVALYMKVNYRQKLVSKFGSIKGLTEKMDVFDFKEVVYCRKCGCIKTFIHDREMSIFVSQSLKNRPPPIPGGLKICDL